MGCSSRRFRQSTMKLPTNSDNSRGETEEEAFQAWHPTANKVPILFITPRDATWRRIQEASEIFPIWGIEKEATD